MILLTLLSSRLTFGYKFLLPLAFFLVFCFQMFDVWQDTINGRNVTTIRFNENVNITIIGSAIWFFVIVINAGVGSSLRRVRVDQVDLYISNYFREIIVPLCMLSDVTENRWVNIHPITLHFRTATEFGNTITFMPKVRFCVWGVSHPVVDNLKQMAGLSGASAKSKKV